jgi:hypothetical protein
MILVLPRYFDDHYIFNNIITFLNGSWRPRHAYYGSLSYLPQAFALKLCDWLHSLTGIGAFAVRGGPIEGFTLGAFRIMRMFGLAYALLSIWVIYLVGRRLFSPAVGLIAAAVLAAYPQHLRSTAQLKPDMLVLMLTVVTLYWTISVVRDPRLSRFLLAGVGVGLATAAKYIGVAAALPLAVWALWAGFHHRRLWGRLVLAGVASIVTFLILNPFFGTVFRFAPHLVKFYSARARSERSDHWVVVRGEVNFLAAQHGWLLGALLFVGIASLALRFWRQKENGEPLLPLSLCLGYPALYAVGMSLFRTHNLLPALAGTALVIACGAVFGTERLGRRRASLGSPAAILVVSSLLGAYLLIRPVTSAYRQLIPSTWAFAGKTLRARLAPTGSRAHQVAYEPADVKLGFSAGGQRIAVPSLAALAPARLDLTDAEAFPLARTEGPRASFYKGRRQRLSQRCVVEVRPRLFQSRGAPILLLLHPWTPAGPAVPIGLRRSGSPPNELIGRFPADLTAGEALSLELIRPAPAAAATVLLQPGDRSLPLQFAAARRRKVRFSTPRFRYSTGLAEIHLSVAAGAYPRNFQLQLRRWEQAPCP